MACEALFGNLSSPNAEYCEPGDGKCSAGLYCDITTHRCMPDPNADGGSGVDGGTEPAGGGRTFFAADPIFVPIADTGMPNSQGVMYRGDFDGNGVPDIFVMGQTRFLKVMNPAAAANISGPFSYKMGGNPEAVAIGRLDSDSKDDMAIVLDSATPYLEVLLSGDGSDTTIALTETPRAVGIGDFNGDSLNDIAIGYLSGRVEIKYSNTAGVNAATKNVVAADVTVPVSSLTAMKVPSYINANKTQDLLVGIRSGNPTLIPNRLKIIRGNTTNEPTMDSVDLSAIPDEIETGQFLSAGQYDAAVLVGNSGLDIIRNLTSAMPPTGRTSYTFSALYSEPTQPNKGKLAVGRLSPDAQTRSLDDLAVLMQDGLLSVYAGGATWSNSPPLVVGRGLAAEKILIGAFDVGSTQDAVAGYSDTAQGATIAVSRYFGTGTATLPNLAQQHTLTNGAGANERVLTGAFGAVGSRDFAMVGGTAMPAAVRCTAGTASSYSCAAPLVLTKSVASATTVTCADRRARIVAASSDSKLHLIDLVQGTQSETIVSTATSNAPLQVEVADLNGDTNPDVVVRILGGKLERSFSTADCLAGSTFQDITPAAANITRFALVDVNGDGKVDLVTGEQGKVKVFLNPGTGLFSNSATYITTGNLGGAAVGDFRGTNTRELAILLSPDTTGNSKLVWLSGQVAGATLTETFKTDLPHRYEMMAAADVNGDGRPDLALLSMGRRVVTYVSGTSPQVAVAKLSHYSVGRRPTGIAFGNVDFDATSPIDLVLSDNNPQLAGSTTSAWILQGLRSGQSLP